MSQNTITESPGRRIGRTGLAAHPIAAAWPDLDAKALDALAQDIAQNNLKHPIVVDGDDRSLILDGVQRARAFAVLDRVPGIGHMVEFRKGASQEEKVAFVLSQNQHRRHLGPGERADAVVAAYLAAGLTFAERGRPENGSNEPIVSVTRKQVAEAADVSDITARRAIQRARQPQPSPARPRSPAAKVDALAKAAGKRAGLAVEKMAAEADEAHALELDQEADHQAATVTLWRLRPMTGTRTAKRS